VKLKSLLCGITGLIVQCCNPEEILLFGSYAKQQDTVDSDLDILVIGNFRESRYLRGQEVHALQQRYPIKIDLHFVTPEEVSAESTKRFGFLSSALANSVILYSRGHARERGKAMPSNKAP